MRLREVDGRPVVSAQSGERLGRVRQVVLDLAEGRIAGFRLRSGGLLDRRWRIAAMQDVTALTDEAVVVPDAVALREDVRCASHVMLHGRGPTLHDADGTVLGRLADAIVNPENGALIALLVSPASRRGTGTTLVPVDRVRLSEGHITVVANGPRTSARNGCGTTPATAPSCR